MISFIAQPKSVTNVMARTLTLQAKKKEPKANLLHGLPKLCCASIALEMATTVRELGSARLVS